jgi:hypothetical protein
VKLSKLTRQAVIHLTQRLVEFIAFASGHDRVTPVDVHNCFDSFRVLLFVKNDLHYRNPIVILGQFGEKRLGPGLKGLGEGRMS